jgi:hypothetical protein
VRILAFFNQVQQVSDIMDTLIQDDPADGPGRTIGPALAARILKVRAEQDAGQFDTLEQLDAIPGFGAGIWKDLVYSFGRTAAEAFRDSLYVNNVIYRENWPVWIFEFPIENTEHFQELAGNEAAYRAFISEKLSDISQQGNVVDSLAQAAITGVKTAHIERFQDEILSALSFGIWFYRLDPGNWFSFERMYEQTLAYFQYYVPRYAFQQIYYSMPIELITFKGVPGNIMNPSGIIAPDLVTVLDHQAQRVTIWMGTLYD